jgi:CDP-diacylglycerol---glycerol-3-phosphate 3-phosphatidyltransferase
MFSRHIQQRARQLIAFLIQPLARVGVTPNMLTIVGLLLSGITALVIAQGHMFVGGLLILFAGIFDMFDGAMARVQNAATSFGAFLDSTLDRYSESIILFGLLWYALQHPGQHDQFWPVPAEQSWMIIFIFLAVVGSLMVSYTKARAEGLGIECKTGLLARPERVVILAIGLLSHTGMLALALLAVLTHVTAVERMFAVWQATRKTPEVHSAAPHTLYATGADDHHSPTATGMNETSRTDVQPLHTSVPPFTESVQQD